TDEREMMVLVRLTDPRDALHRRLVADVAAQRIAGIGRVNDYSTVADDRDRLPDQPRLRIFRMDFEEATWHGIKDLLAAVMNAEPATRRAVSQPQLSSSGLPAIILSPLTVSPLATCSCCSTSSPSLLSSSPTS